jgi:hypothetical protein
VTEHLATYRRNGAGQDERLAIGVDGSFTLWRTAGEHRVGAFGGTVDIDGLRAAIDRASPVEPVYLRPPRSAAVEQMAFGDGRSSSFFVGAALPPGLSELADDLRHLTRDLTTMPIAAVEAVFEPASGPGDGCGRLTLSAIGTEPIGVDLARGTVEVVLVDSPNMALGTFSAKLSDLVGEEDLGTTSPGDPDGLFPNATPRAPGWQAVAAVAHGLPLTEGDLLVADATFRLTWRDTRTNVSVAFRLALNEPLTEGETHAGW